MTLDNPKDILSKINSIKDNIDYLNKSEIIPIKPSIVKHSLISFPNNYLCINYNNIPKKDISKINSESIFQNINISTQSSSYNKINTFNNINNSLNLNEDISLKGVYDSLFNANFLKTNQISNYISNYSNKLIKPVFYHESNTNNRINFTVE